MDALPVASALARAAVLRARLEERQVLVEDVLDAEEDIAESGAPHQRRERRRRARRSADVIPWTI